MLSVGCGDHARHAGKQGPECSLGVFKGWEFSYSTEQWNNLITQRQQDGSLVIIMTIKLQPFIERCVNCFMCIHVPTLMITPKHNYYALYCTDGKPTGQGD